MFYWMKILIAMSKLLIISIFVKIVLIIFGNLNFLNLVVWIESTYIFIKAILWYFKTLHLVKEIIFANIKPVVTIIKLRPINSSVSVTYSWLCGV